MSISIRILAVSAVAMGLAACSSGPHPATTAAAPAVATGASEVDAIADLLDRGDTKEARKRLTGALKKDPLNASLLVLNQGLNGDAKEDLGPVSYAYTVAAGDTMAGLAERFLGNRLKSYQLARYNGIDDPSTIQPGQVLRIPGEPLRAAPEKRSSAPPPAPRRSAAPAEPAPKPAVPPPAPPAQASTPAVDTAAAQRARTAGLAALNKGNVASAVALLQRAAALDPHNAAIARDLARARRIAATVKSRR